MYWKKVFPFMNRLHTNNTIFQQDNTAIYTSKLMKDLFKTKNIGVLDWSTKSKPNRKLVGNFVKKRI